MLIDATVPEVPDRSIGSTRSLLAAGVLAGPPFVGITADLGTRALGGRALG